MRSTDVGGSSYLADLTNQVTTASHVAHYGEIVKKNKILRDLIRASAEITEEAFDSGKELDDLMDIVEKKIFDISQKSTPQNLLPLKDELTGAYERMAKLADGGDKLRGVTTGFPALDNKLVRLPKIRPHRSRRAAVDRQNIARTRHRPPRRARRTQSRRSSRSKCRANKSSTASSPPNPACRSGIF